MLKESNVIVEPKVGSQAESSHMEASVARRKIEKLADDVSRDSCLT